MNIKIKYKGLSTDRNEPLCKVVEGNLWLGGKPEQMEMARLEYIIISSWNMETRRRAVDALASYGKKALDLDQVCI